MFMDQVSSCIAVLNRVGEAERVPGSTGEHSVTNWCRIERECWNAKRGSQRNCSLHLDINSDYLTNAI